MGNLVRGPFPVTEVGHGQRGLVRPRRTEFNVYRETAKISIIAAKIAIIAAA